MDPVSLAIKGRIKCCEHHNLLNIGQNFGTSPQAVWQVRNCIESMSQAPKLFLRSVTDHVWGDLPLNTKHSVVSFSLLGISSTLRSALLLHWCTGHSTLVHWSLEMNTATALPWPLWVSSSLSSESLLVSVVWVTAGGVKQSFFKVLVVTCCLSQWPFHNVSFWCLVLRQRQGKRQRQKYCKCQAVFPRSLCCSVLSEWLL